MRSQLTYQFPHHFPFRHQINRPPRSFLHGRFAGVDAHVVVDGGRDVLGVEGAVGDVFSAGR